MTFFFKVSWNKSFKFVSSTHNYEEKTYFNASFQIAQFACGTININQKVKSFAIWVAVHQYIWIFYLSKTNTLVYSYFIRSSSKELTKQIIIQYGYLDAKVSEKGIQNRFHCCPPPATVAAGHSQPPPFEMAPKFSRTWCNKQRGRTPHVHKHAHFIWHRSKKRVCL